MIVPILIVVCGITLFLLSFKVKCEGLKLAMIFVGVASIFFDFLFAILPPFAVPDYTQAKIASEYLKTVTPTIENADEIARAKGVVKYYNEIVTYRQQYAKDMWVGWFFDDSIMDYELVK